MKKTKKEKPTREQYTVQLEPEFVDKLDEFAAKQGLSRSQLMRNLLQMAYDDVVMLDKMGVFATVTLGQKLLRAFKEAILNGKLIYNEKEGLQIRK